MLILLCFDVIETRVKMNSQMAGVSKIHASLTVGAPTFPVTAAAREVIVTVDTFGFSHRQSKLNRFLSGPPLSCLACTGTPCNHCY